MQRAAEDRLCFPKNDRGGAAGVAVLFECMATNRLMGEHIEVTPGIAGGRPRIAGHRVRVQDVVVWHDLLGMSPEEIIGRCPGLGLADVYAALAYYHDHADEIRRHIDEDEALVDALKAQTSSKLVQKLTARDGGDDPLPPR